VSYLPGLLALALIIGTLVGALAGLLSAAGPGSQTPPSGYVVGVLRFTLLQAALSTVLSVALGAMLALALARRAQFRGRRAFIAALNLASVLPAVVAVFGIVAVYGRAGWIGAAAARFGVDAAGWLYGLPGILIAHVFFNAPVAARVFLAALQAVPGEHWRLAAQLGMGPAAIFRILDAPTLRREAPTLAALIFLLCFTSFAIVLTLGGGPAAATLEVAIYEAVRFDVDFGRAGRLALLQIAVSLLIAAPLLLSARRPAEAAATGFAAPRPDIAAAGLRVLDGAVLTLAALLILPPLAAIAISGIAASQSLFRAEVAAALATSLAIALPAAAIALGLALSIANAARKLRSRGERRAAALIGLPANLYLAAPPIAVSAGLFVVLQWAADPFALAIPLIVLVNALMALPFAMALAAPPIAVAAERYGRLADSLGIFGRARLGLVDWPLLRGPLAAAAAVSAALSLGDLGVAAFFGSGEILTLPLLLYQRMGAYRLEEAASVGALLVVLVLALFLAAQKWSGEMRARSR
jgi:thiamine transport system permease protein